MTSEDVLIRADYRGAFASDELASLTGALREAIPDPAVSIGTYHLQYYRMHRHEVVHLLVNFRFRQTEAARLHIQRVHGRDIELGARGLEAPSADPRPTAPDRFRRRLLRPHRSGRMTVCDPHACHPRSLDRRTKTLRRACRSRRSRGSPRAADLALRATQRPEPARALSFEAGRPAPA